MDMQRRLITELNMVSILAVVAVVFSVATTVVQIADGYPSGAPTGTCLTLLPRHSGEPQTNASPYRIEVNTRGTEVQIDLVGNEPFRGFLLNARLASDPQRIVPGTFSSAVDPNAQTLDCLGERASGLTHADGNDKSAIRAVWTPAAEFSGQIIFMGAVVKSFNHFWSALRSTEVSVRGSGTARQRPRIPDYVYDNCGRREGCFGLPVNCIAQRKCDLVLGYREEPGYGYFFQMISLAAANKYVAAGLSQDNLMGDDAVVECIDVQSSLDIRESWNKASSNKGNEVQPLSNIQKVAQSSHDGVQTCQWRRPYITAVKSRTYDLRDRFYVLLAIGNMRENGDKHYHDSALASSALVDFSAIRVERGDNSQLWVQAHATLMTSAWLFTASMGMMLARHFKNVWEDKMPCGVKMWFACHRVFMVLTLLLSLAGVAIMFYRFGKFNSQAGWHPIFGLICVGLCICQPIMALFRCHPGTKRRPLFNWAHWFVGNAAQIIGVVAIFLAADLPRASLQNVHWFIWLIVAFVVFHVLSHLLLQIHGFSVDKRVSAVPDIHLQTMGSNNTGMMSPSAMVETKDSPGSDFRRFMLGIYIIGLLFIVGAMLAVIWLTGSDLLQL
ncbi:putative ferric-chelate reductase 1-like [Tropilaelaps mercedesae]|uniref:Putative ferric-chelate reductase 1-like n=1 Tax=Tropilaelaps mercedesae TaxID=418985 RepID=A0A1V9XNT4_9ACAR|nr:putative ferric-chelate reductase 1-like [Tropilaelaps mercedesae]